MNFLGKIFTWWDGATIGTLLWSSRNGEHVGTDVQGNRYYRSKKKTGTAGNVAGSFTKAPMTQAAFRVNGTAGSTGLSTTYRKAIFRLLVSGKPIILRMPLAR